MWFTMLAAKRPLGRQTEPRMTTRDIVCVHTMVGYLHSTDTMFKRDGYGGTESHFGIGGTWGSDRALSLNGVAYQWQDTDFTADANLNGNHRVLSIETADNAPALARDIEPWTPAQVVTLVRIVAALCKRYDIPAQLIPDTKPGRRGLAYHAQGIDPKRVTGGELWSSARGKECPGPARIDQFIHEVIPKVQLALNPTKVDDMTPDEMLRTKVALTSQAQVNAMNSNRKATDTQFKIGDTIDLAHFFRWGGPGQERILHSVRDVGKQADALAATVAKLSAKVDALAAKLDVPPPPAA